MAQEGESGADRDEEAVTFAQALAELKQRGSALLVVGTVPDEMYVRVSRQMLGDPGAEQSRRRLLVYREGNRQRAAERLRDTGPITPEYARLVAYSESARSVSAAASPSTDSALDPSSLPKEHAVGESLSDLGVAVSDVIEQFDATAHDLGPAELRVALDCLPSLLGQYDVQQVFRFLHILVTEVRRADGIAHVHLPRERTDDTVLTLEPLFDAVVELSIERESLHQRWDLRDSPLVSDWLPVE